MFLRLSDDTYLCPEMRQLDHPPRMTGDGLRRYGIRGLHCGSSLSLLPDCINTDLLTFGHPAAGRSESGRVVLIANRFRYLKHDAGAGFPFEDHAFDWVYAQHFLEHLPPATARSWMREMYRLVRPGGLIRLTTPDLCRYMLGAADPAGAFAHHRCRVLSDSGCASARPDRAWVVNQAFKHWGHQWLYDESEIRHLVEDAGIPAGEVRRQGFQQGRDMIPACHDHAAHADETLYIEIVREHV